MAFSGLIYRERLITEKLARFGIVPRLIAGEMYFAEPTRWVRLNPIWGQIATIEPGYRPFRQFTPKSQVWDALVNRKRGASRAGLKRRLLAGQERLRAELAYRRDESMGEAMEMLLDLNKVKVAVPG